MGLRDWFARLGGRPDPAEATPPRPRTPTAEDIGTALDGVEQLVAGGAVPPLVQSRVRRVVSTVRDTVPRLRNLGPGSTQAYSVVATATDYLPQAIGQAPGLKAVIYGAVLVGFVLFEPLGLYGIWIKIRNYWHGWPFSY